MLFSLIIPVYNVEDCLPKCIDSIRKQTYKNFELILVNDGSTDKSKEICDNYSKYDDRIKVIDKKNGGAASARNKGLKIAKGDYIYFIDSDDYLAHDKVLEHISEIIKENNYIDMIVTKQIAFKDGQNNFYKVHKYSDLSIINGENGIDGLLKLCKTSQMVVSVYSYIIKRRIIIKNNIYFIEGFYCEDIDWTPRVFLAAKKIWALDEFVYCRRQGRKGQVTYKKNIKRDIDGVKILDKWFSKKGSCHLLKNRKDAIFFWDYLGAIFVSIITNQYYYYGEENKTRINELFKYSYILDNYYRQKLSFGKFIYKIFGFKSFVYIMSSIKFAYRFLKKCIRSIVHWFFRKVPD